MAEMLKNTKAASVSFQHVTKVYGKTVTAVHDVSLEIEPGKLVTLLGPSGCGKTTMLRMIAGLEMATKGKIFIGDTDVSTLPATDRDVSMVFQSYALFPHMSVLENVSYGLKYSGFDKEETRSRALAGLDLVGLNGYDSRLPSELSGGQQQRVAVARAIVSQPKLVLADEPTANLDSKSMESLMAHFRELNRSHKVTFLIATHDQRVMEWADRLISMEDGRVVSDELQQAIR